MKRQEAEGVSAGRLIHEELTIRGWSMVADLAKATGRPLDEIQETIDGIGPLTPETAQGLADVFGATAELWLELEKMRQGTDAGGRVG